MEAEAALATSHRASNSLVATTYLDHASSPLPYPPFLHPSNTYDTHISTYSTLSCVTSTIVSKGATGLLHLSSLTHLHRVCPTSHFRPPPIPVAASSPPFYSKTPVEMPPINQAAISVGVVVTSMAVAAAIAIYESPELQRMANDLRRKIAIALHSLGDGILPEHATGPNGEPLFNRPEDAEGFLQSAEVDADDETRRRQREELMYWNALRLSNELEKQTTAHEDEKRHHRKNRSSTDSSSTTFDDFLREDKTADEKGTYVFNTGADVVTRSHNDTTTEGLVRRRGASEGVRGLNASLYANPFADEYGIDHDEQDDDSQIAPERDEVTSDIYNATPRETPASPPSRTMTPVSMPDLIPMDQTEQEEPNNTYAQELFAQTKSVSAPSEPASHTEIEAESVPEYMTAGQPDAYASIQEWAQQQSSGAHSSGGMDSFYSPLPVTPTAPSLSEMSEGELVSEGQLTPTSADSASVVDVEAESQDGDANSSAGRYYDVLSEDEDGIATPAHSWTEVGSVVSESEDGMQNPTHA